MDKGAAARCTSKSKYQIKMALRDGAHFVCRASTPVSPSALLKKSPSGSCSKELAGFNYKVTPAAARVARLHRRCRLLSFAGDESLKILGLH